MSWLTHDDVDRQFTYQAPTFEQVEAIRRVRAMARELAHLILDATPAGADQSAAIRQLRECVMTANAAIVLPAKPPRAGRGSGTRSGG